jgi:hypothetical protein
MTIGILTRRYLAEYARRPVNLGLLVLVPLVFVALASGAIAQFAEVVGGVTDASRLAAPAAGWAAAFLAGVAGFFHVLDSRQADRRIARAGLGAIRVLAARLLSGVVLATLASSAALVALWLWTGVGDPVRVIGGTLMFSLVYLGIGVAVGSIVHSDVNGSLVVVFIWMVDVFLGPAMAGGAVWITRLFPSHFVTLVMLDDPSGHAGPPGDIGWAVAWTIGAIVVAGVVFAASTRMPGSRRVARIGGWRRLAAGFRAGLNEYRRNIAMWVLMVALPVFFISLSFYVTPTDPTPVDVVEQGVAQARILSMADVHGAIMVPITVAFLAGLAGLFVVQGSLEADARLALAGFRPCEILGSRFGVIGVAAGVVTGVSLAVTALDFSPQSWGSFAMANLVVAVTYGMVGVLVGVLFGRLGGLYVMFLLPFVDVGIAQNVMFSSSPPSWGSFLPARGAVRVLVDAAFTPTFDHVGSIVLAAVWLGLVGLAASAVFHRVAQSKSV